MTAHRTALALGLAGLLVTTSAAAQIRPGQTDQDDMDTARDIATTPLTDLNIDGKDIPPALLNALQDPYSTEGVGRCSAIIAAVQELDAELGPDFDTPVDRSTADARRDGVGRLGRSIVGGIIPFRGLVREVTGAAGKERALQQAVYAGLTRRAFLKGMGEQRRCRTPGRPADIETMPEMD